MVHSISLYGVDMIKTNKRSKIVAVETEFWRRTCGLIKMNRIDTKI